MAHCLLVDSDEELFGSDESDEDFEIGDEEPETEDSYNSDESDFDESTESTTGEANTDDLTLLLSKNGKVQYSCVPPPLGRPVGRNSFSNKGGII